MSTFSLFSLLDNRSRPTPQRTSRGNHYASIIDAWLVTWNNEYLAWASIPIADWKADRLDILLFLSDQPVLIDLRSHWGTSTTPYAAAASDWQEPAVSVTGNLTGNAIFTPNAATTELGQHATGISTTNALAVSGYLLKTQPITRAIQNGETALDPQIHIRTIGESGVFRVYTLFSDRSRPTRTWTTHTGYSARTRLHFNNVRKWRSIRIYVGRRKIFISYSRTLSNQVNYAIRHTTT